MAVITLKANNKKVNNRNIDHTLSNNSKGAGSVFIYTSISNEIYVLLGLEYNGEYNIALGKRDGDETFVEAASRELQEEMHIDISAKDLQTYPYWIDTQKINNKVHNVVVLYFVFLPLFIPSSYFKKHILRDDKLTLLDYEWVPLKLLLDTDSRNITLASGETIKLRRYFKSILKLFQKKKINNLIYHT